MMNPVGACVGLRGARVQEVVRALNSEAIDVVTWSEDPLELLEVRLPSAYVKGIIYDHNEKAHVEVVVPDDQLSKAIGRQGQNVRLASQLTNLRIDIFSESKYNKVIMSAVRALGNRRIKRRSH